MSQYGNYKPKPPLLKIINESKTRGFCSNCGSSLVGWNKKCLNNECEMTNKEETHRDGSISIGKKDQIPPIIIDGVEQVVNEYEKTPAKTTGGKVLRFLSRFLPFLLRRIK